MGNHFSINLIYLRKKHLLNQGGLSKMFGMRQAQISQIENSKSPPTVEFALRVSQEFNVSLDDLFFKVLEDTEKQEQSEKVEHTSKTIEFLELRLEDKEKIIETKDYLISTLQESLKKMESSNQRLIDLYHKKSQ